MTEKILLVDDDPNLLSALRRQLRNQFIVHTSPGGDAALPMIEQGEQYAVVVSDLSMPGMDGIQFLSKVHEISPDTVRVMLTGTADIDAAISAVNESNIFRFLTKPVAIDMLVKTLEASLTQYRLITSEKELLKNTLNGSIRVLVDMLTLFSPVTFRRATRITEYVDQIAEQLMVPNSWQFELAALLSQIGCILLPKDILEKVNTGLELTEAEKNIFASHPITAKGLLMNIPRLDSIAQMIAHQLEPYQSDHTTASPPLSASIRLGASMLKAALDYDTLVTSGLSPQEAIAAMDTRHENYDPIVLSALAEIHLQYVG